MLLYPPFYSIRRKAINLNSEDENLFAHEYSKLIHATTLEFLKPGYILDDTVFNLKRFKFYPTYTHVNGYFDFEQKKKYLLFFLKNKHEVKNGIWITQNWTWMYFHWITDALTRLVACDEYIKDHVVILPISYKKFAFIEDSIKMLDYKIHWIDFESCTKVNHLMLPSQTSSPGNYNDEILNRLRAKFLKNKIKNQNKIIYVSRRKAAYRHIENEEGVIKLMENYGAEIHCFEDYSFENQVKLLNKCSYLIGLHGGGLTNMIFMAKGTKILEIRKEDDSQNNCYFSMASALEIDYYYFFGKKCEKVNDTIKIDTKELELTLVEMGLKKYKKNEHCN